MVSSLDGIIAKKDNSVSWFETLTTTKKELPNKTQRNFLKQ